jgi:hypothetical protein
VKYLAGILLVGGIACLIAGFSWHGPAIGDVDANPNLAGVLGAERSVRLVILGAVASTIGGYLLSRVPGGRSLSQLRADLALLHVRVCPKCTGTYHSKDCTRKLQFGVVPRLVCPNCGVLVSQSNFRIILTGIVLLYCSFLAFLAPLVFRHSESAVLAYSCFISFIIGIFMCSVGLLRRNPQPRAFQVDGSEHKAKS